MGNRITKGKGLFGAIVVGTGGVTLTNLVRGTLALDPASINARDKGTVFATVSGAGANDAYEFRPPATLETTLFYAGYVPAAGSVGVIIGNMGTAAVNGGTLDWAYTRLAMS